MTSYRMDHAGVVVEDLAAAIAFFVELGLELEGEAAVEGEWVDQLVGLDGVRADIAVVRTPDGHGRVELSTFHTPVATSIAPRAPMNTPGIPRLTFVVDAVDDVLDRLRAHGAELVGEPRDGPRSVGGSRRCGFARAGASLGRERCCVSAVPHPPPRVWPGGRWSFGAGAANR